jgi:hypothetical protein
MVFDNVEKRERERESQSIKARRKIYASRNIPDVWLSSNPSNIKAYCRLLQSTSCS